MYKQQMRALNLIHSLRETDRLRRGQTIAIIGAGVSGITAAAGAFILGYRVHLFEKREILCHLQQGCETRWIHPHLYDWPKRGAQRQSAGLPFLDWRASTSADVVEQIMSGFNAIIARDPDNFQFIPGVNVTFPSRGRVKWDGGDKGEEAFDAIVFAFGYGVERSVRGAKSKSYWRNDSLNQIEPGVFAPATQTCLISGTGDGGLIDLIRTKINGYNQGRLLHEFFDGEATLLRGLRTIREKWERNAPGVEKKTWLYDQFNDLHRDGLLKNLLTKIELRKRDDTRSILNGPPRYLSQALTLNRASLLNTLLVYCLERCNAFDYVGGQCSSIEKKIAYIGTKQIKVDRVVVRHGPDTLAVCKRARFREGVPIFSGVPSVSSIGSGDTSRRLWPAGWWSQKAKYFLAGDRVEYVPAATLTVANTFVSTLADIIKLQHTKSEPRFRIALHRLIQVHDEEYFQQISRYAGTRQSGMPGRVFDISSGIVGLSCRMGRPVIVNRAGHFDEIWEALDLRASRAREVDTKVQSLFACPFFAPFNPQVPGGRIPLVLFVDSEQKNFFTNNVLRIIYGACKGFVENIEEMRRNRELHFIDSDYLGHRVRRSREAERIVRVYSSIVTDRGFGNFRKDLMFKSVTAFDMELNYNRNNEERG